MSYKQILLAVDEDLLKKIKYMCARETKRSISGQLRFLIDMLPDPEQISLLKYLGERTKEYQNNFKPSEKLVNLTIKFIDEDEYWQAKMKATAMRLAVKDLATIVFQLWASEKWEEFLKDIHLKTGTNS